MPAGPGGNCQILDLPVLVINFLTGLQQIGRVEFQRKVRARSEIDGSMACSHSCDEDSYAPYCYPNCLRPMPTSLLSFRITLRSECPRASRPHSSRSLLCAIKSGCCDAGRKSARNLRQRIVSCVIDRRQSSRSGITRFTIFLEQRVDVSPASY